MCKLLAFSLSLYLMLAFPPGGKQDTASTAALPQAEAQFPPHTGDIGQQRQPDVAERKMRQEQQKKFNQQRHADLKRDTDKLLLLATQLKQAVDKSNENTLSLDVIKKAGEIEKLAKSVREKMRGWN